MKKNYFIFFLLLILIYNVTSVINVEINNLDELWNFSFANNIINGNIPYKNFNMITTPLSPYLLAIIFKIFDAQVIVQRIFSTLIMTLIEYLIYKILTKLKINNNIILITIFIIALTTLISYNYNYISLLLLLILIYLELNDKKDFFIGLITGFCFLTKQTIGIFIIIATIVVSIIKRKKIKKRIIGIMLPIIIFIIYLILSNSVNEFINYTISGIKTFNNHIPYFNLFYNKSFYITFMSFFMPLFLIVNVILIIKYKDLTKIIINIYSIAFFTIIYPICDSEHFLIGIIPFYILIAYNFNTIFKVFKNTFFIFYLFFCGILLTLILNNTFTYINLYKSKLNHYKFVPINKNLENEIIQIDNFLLKRKTYIIDANAVIFMIPIDTYNKDFDLLLKGNIGLNNQILKKKIKENKDTYLILSNKKNLNWQSINDIIYYTEKVKKKKSNIGNYNIYE